MTDTEIQKALDWLNGTFSGDYGPNDPVNTIRAVLEARLQEGK